MRDTAYIRDKHDMRNVGIPSSGMNSFFEKSIEAGLSAEFHRYGVLIQQWGKQDALLLYSTHYSAGMRPPGGTAITGWTPYLIAAQANTPYEHPMGYPPEAAEPMLESTQWSARKSPGR